MKEVHKKTILDPNDGGKKDLRQVSLHEMNRSKAEMGPQMYNKLNRALAIACAIDIRPISLTMGKGFRSFCHLLNPKYKVPCSNTVKKNVLLIYNEEKARVIQEISGEVVSVTTDLWTAIGARSYITFTGHLINSSWEYKSIVLATRPLDIKHTGVNIADAITKVQAEFSISKIGGLTTDNASNMRVAGSLLGVIQWMCFCHGLQLAVQEGMKAPTVKKAFSGASNLVGHFNKSSSATSALVKQQEKENEELDKDEKKPVKRLIQACVTRWNSHYAMAQRLLDLRIPVFKVLMDQNITNQKQRQTLDLTDASWKVLEDIVPVLRPFAQATEVLTREDAPTLGQVLVLVNSLVNRSCQVDSEDSGAVKKMKMTIKKELIKRFALTDDGAPKDVRSPAVIAAFLDPRYKNLKFMTDDTREELLNYVAELLPEAESIRKEEDEEAKNEWNILDCLMGDVQDVQDLTSGCSRKEIDQYMAEPVRTDPLAWWRANESRYCVFFSYLL